MEKTLPDKKVFGMLVDKTHTDKIIAFLKAHSEKYGTLDLKLSRFEILYISQTPEQQGAFLNMYKQSESPFNFIKKYHRNGKAFIPEIEFNKRSADYSKPSFRRKQI